jgi:hypothetical protein
MSQSSTPLSDLIERCLEQADAATDAANFERFLEAFVGARLGVMVTGKIEGATPGGTVVVREGQASCAMVDLPQGGRMLAACADRPAFRRRSPLRFNAEVDARTLLTIALANEACRGIMVNSALTERSVALARELLPGLLARCQAPSPPPVAWKRTTQLPPASSRRARRRRPPRHFSTVTPSGPIARAWAVPP